MDPYPRQSSRADPLDRQGRSYLRRARPSPRHGEEPSRRTPARPSPRAPSSQSVSPGGAPRAGGGGGGLAPGRSPGKRLLPPAPGAWSRDRGRPGDPGRAGTAPRWARTWGGAKGAARSERGSPPASRSWQRETPPAAPRRLPRPGRELRPPPRSPPSASPPPPGATPPRESRAEPSGDGGRGGRRGARNRQRRAAVGAAGDEARRDPALPFSSA